MTDLPRLRRIAVPLILLALALAGTRGASAQGEVVIPAETVIRLELDQRLSSATARVGDTFAAVLSRQDTSGFPDGTRFQGEVTEVQRFEKNERPGMLDVRFRRAFLPDGQRVNLDGRLASLADEDVRRTDDGRIEARPTGGRRRTDWRWAGYGAAGGAVLSALLRGNILRGALLGGVGGAIYSVLGSRRERETYRDVDLPRGTEFGMLVQQRVAFAGRPDYRYTARQAFLAGNNNNAEQVAGGREEFRYGPTTVRLNGQDVNLGETRPINVDGTLYVPLAPIAQAANLRLQHRAGADRFTLQTPSGPARAFAGDPTVRGSGQPLELERPPHMFDGTIYVPIEYLSRVAGLGVQWNRADQRLDLDRAP
jgi:hypothetical protein